MFQGGSFGVGVTVTDLRPWSAEALPPGVTDPAELVPPGVTVRRTRLGELMPVDARTDGELATELQRVVQVEGMLAAYKAELVAAFAGHRPDSLDVPAGRPGAGATPPGHTDALPEFVGTSEFFADELALVLNCSRTAATTLIGQSFILLGRLPVTWAALADGHLDWPRARGLAAELGTAAGETDPAIISEVEAAVLPTAAEMSVRSLRAAARRELFSRDAAAAERRRAAAERTADVIVRPAADGMAELAAFLPQPAAAAIRETVDTYARMLRADGDQRPLGMLRAQVVVDLVLRPWDTSRPPVTAQLTLIAPLPTLSGAPCGDDRPGSAGQAGSSATSDGRPARKHAHAPAEVNGQPITAAQLGTLLEELDALCPGGLQAPFGGDLTIALTDSRTGRLRAAVSRRELERLARRGCPHHPPGGEGRVARGASATVGRLHVLRARQAAPDRPLRAHPGATPVREDPGPHLPSPGVLQQGGLGRPRPRRPPRGRRRDRL